MLRSRLEPSVRSNPVPIAMFVRTFLGLAATAATCLSASLQEVTNFGDNPSNIQMYIYVPDQLAANPPVIVAVRNLSLFSTQQSGACG